MYMGENLPAIESNQIKEKNNEVEKVPKLKKLNRFIFAFCILATALVIAVSLFVSKNQQNTVSQKIDKTSDEVYDEVPIDEGKIESLGNAVYILSGSDPEKLVDLSTRSEGSFGDIEPILKGKDIYVADAHLLYRYSLSDKTRTELFRNTQGDSPIMSFNISQNGHIYISLEPKEYYSKETDFQVVEIDSSGQIVRNIEKIPHVFYGGINYLFNWNGEDIIASFGGDGCGGWGTISKLKEGQTTDIAKTGGGCVQDPRYVGFDENKGQIILAEIIKTPYSDDMDFTSDKYDVLYGLNVSNLEKIPLFDLKKIPDITGFSLSGDRKILAIISDTQVNLLDMDTREIIRSIEKKYSEDYHIRFFDNNLIGFNSKTNKFMKYDLNSGEIKSRSVLSQKRGQQSIGVLGDWEGSPIFYIKNYSY